jgi:hypothetical protein
MSFILLAIAAIIKAFLDTIVFRSDKSIFPESWSPFKTYTSVPLTFGLIRLDAYHIAMYFFQFAIIGAIYLYKNIMGYADIFIFLIIWGLFFELSWRFFYKPK